MKKTATLTILAAMVMMTALSCTKELNGVVDKSGDTMSLTVNATLPDYATATKNTLVNTIRVKWENDDKVYVYDNAKCLGFLTATVSDEQGKTALLSGEISTSEASNLTLVAMTDDITPSVKDKDQSIPDAGITFDLYDQNLAGAPYVAYATVPKPSGEVSNLSAAFTIATSVERVNCTGLRASTTTDYVAIMGVNTKLTIKPNTDAAPDVTAEKGRGTIKRTNADGFGNVTGDGIMTFSVALLEQDAASRSIYAVQDANRVTEAKFTNGGLLKSGLSYNTVTQFADAEDYVLIEAKYNKTDFTFLKWHKQNLATTDSGKKPWKGSNTSGVKVPGINVDVMIGDYFQWAASYEGYNITEDANKKPENLLIYTSVTHTLCGDNNDAFTFKSLGKNEIYWFEVYDDGQHICTCPYYPDTFDYDELEDPSVSKYGKKNKTVLEKSDDVANIILGGNWRMPTNVELEYMRKATYWAWDATDKGYYVFKPDQGTNGTANGKGNFNPDSDNKEKALLFFPAAGWGFDNHLYSTEGFGYYLSSSVYVPSNNYDFGGSASLMFSPTDGVTIDRIVRQLGASVRPVLD